MKQIYFKTIAVFLLLVTNAVFAIPTEEREALIKLYHATNGEQWYRNDNWLGEVGSECRWKGVECTNDDFTVIRLSLGFNHLKGQIPPELGRLSNLERLDLFDNQLTRIPVELGQLSSLKYLHLSNNELTSVPAELGQLSHLESLGLGNNELTSLPAELEKLSSLMFLQLSRNPLTSLPVELGQLSSLRRLDLNNTELISIPPELGNLSSLEVLFLNNNRLLTSIPIELGKLPNLNSLDLINNRLTRIPAELGDLSNLKNLNLSNNRLTSIPRELSQLSKLTYINFNDNELTRIPIELEQLPSLTTINLSHNQLTGKISDNFLRLFKDDFSNIFKKVRVNLDGNCFDEGASTLWSKALRKSIVEQQRVDCNSSVHFNEQTGLVTFTNVEADGMNYYAELQRLHSNGNQFKLIRTLLLSNPDHIAPAHYDFNTFLLDVPSVFAYEQSYRVQMKNIDAANSVFVIIDAIVK